MINAAVAGLGWWGKVLARELSRSGRFKVIRLVDLRPDAGAQITEPPDAAFSTKFEDVLNDTRVQAVFLATPHTEHDAQINAVSRAGKHVFSEKPLSLTLAGAKASVDACKKAGVVLGIGHERRFEPPMIEMMRLAKSGALGTLLQVETNFSHDKFLALAKDNWRLSPAQAPAGGMTATGIHLLDLAVEILGPATEVLARSATLASSFPSGDSVSALISHASGATSTINVMMVTPFTSHFRVYGSHGWVEVKDKAHLEAPEGWLFTHCRRGEHPVVREFPVATPVRENLVAFADAIEGRAPYPISSEAMLNTIGALEAVFRSAATGAIIRASIR
ncbi:MAG: Gfo/Idh/MocA family protein [Burkholderiales bacterium]